MKKLLVAGVFAALFAVSPASAQNPAYPTPDNNLTRSDDVDPSEAPYLNEEQGQPSSDFDYSVPPSNDGVIVDYGDTGSSAGESGEGEDEAEPPTDAYPPLH